MAVEEKIREGQIVLPRFQWERRIDALDFIPVRMPRGTVMYAHREGALTAVCLLGAIPINREDYLDYVAPPPTDTFYRDVHEAAKTMIASDPRISPTLFTANEDEDYDYLVGVAQVAMNTLGIEAQALIRHHFGNYWTVAAV